MSRITGSDALKMFEAYNAVYASEEQELTEEQVWEEVANWVNSLLEEGYDLSEYTWEEMYEEYLKEYTRQVDRPGQTPAEARSAQQSAKERGASAAKSYQAKADAYKPDPLKTIKNFLSSPGAFSQGRMDSERGIRSSTTQRPKPPASGDYQSRFARPRNAAPGISDIRGGKGSVTPTTTSTDTTPSRPSNSKVAPTRPTAPAKPATGTLGKTSFERRTPTSAELKAAQAARAGGASPEKALQAAKAAGTASKVQSAGQAAGAKAFSSPTAGASAFKPATVASAPSTSPAASGSLAPATARIAAKPSSAMSQDAIRKQRLNMEMEYDAYDLVLEYLLANKHVETVDEAHYVMLEMEAEVIQDIVEETRRTQYLQNKFNKENRRKSGSAHTAIPGKQNTGQALQKARESERHMSGDK